MLRNVLSVRFALLLAALAIASIVVGGTPWGPS